MGLFLQYFWSNKTLKTSWPQTLNSRWNEHAAPCLHWLWHQHAFFGTLHTPGPEAYLTLSVCSVGLSFDFWTSQVMQSEALEVPDSSPTGLVHNPALVQSHISIPAQSVCKRQTSNFHHLCSETLENKTERLQAKELLLQHSSTLFCLKSIW